MNPAIVLALVGGVLGAVWGWRRGTRLLHRVSFLEDGPYGTDRQQRRRLRRRQRLVGTLVRLVGGAFVGFVLGLWLASR